MDVDFERERHWWNAKAPREEQDLGDEPINRALRWREIERHLDGVHTILEVGGGTGAFSLPLARRGFAVTHLDFSPAMIQIARQGLGPQEAQELNIRFVEANAADLSQFPDHSFDLVLNMDGAVSFAGSLAERALIESCRVATKTLIATVSHRARLLPVWVEGSLAVLADFAPAVDAMLDRGEWHQGQFPENPLLTRGMTQDYMGAMRGLSAGRGPGHPGRRRHDGPALRGAWFSGGTLRPGDRRTRVAG